MELLMLLQLSPHHTPPGLSTNVELHLVGGELQLPSARGTGVLLDTLRGWTGSLHMSPYPKWVMPRLGQVQCCS